MFMSPSLKYFPLKHINSTVQSVRIQLLKYNVKLLRQIINTDFLNYCPNAKINENKRCNLLTSICTTVTV